MIPGEIVTAAGDLELNAGRRALRLSVANTGDRPIQVGSHYHFAEIQPGAALRSDTGTRFADSTSPLAPPCVSSRAREREVDLIDYAGAREVYGFRAAIMGPLEDQP